ncbi:MAG: fimbria/pilus periplasmic chaperone [Burkholderiaceae bacterium]|nr:fimbria/pilus periplasmic chaperone [Burkholderiaceae bacterium]
MFAAISKSRGRLGVLTALGLVTCAVNALTISPVIVELSPARRVVSITVTNPSESALNFQAEALAWSQPDGHDRYEDTTDLMVVPPIAEIAPGASQIFRVTTRTPPSQREQAYRLILEDVTDETAALPDSATVNIRVRHSLPVFVAASGQPRASAQLGPCAAPAGKGCVRLDNDGERYLMVKALTIEGGAWRKEIPLGTRVLAGARREWRFDLPAHIAAPLQVRVETSAGAFVGEIPLSLR